MPDRTRADRENGSLPRARFVLIAIVMSLTLAFAAIAKRAGFALAQDESSEAPAPEASPDLPPVTAGDAERAGQAPSPSEAAQTPEALASPEASSSPAVESTPEAAAPSSSPTVESTPEAAAPSPSPQTSPAPSTTISKEPAANTHKRAVASSSAKKSKRAASRATPVSKPEQEQAASKPSGGKSTAPANSPFAGFNFGNSSGPIHIDSEQMLFDQKDKSVLFSGHVRAVQTGGELTSKTLKVLFTNEKLHDIDELIADGDVRMSQGTRWATGDHAVLNEAKQTVTLTGNPVVHDGEDQITGSRITVYLQTGKSVVEGARAVIFPRRSENTDNVASPDHQ